MMDESTQPLPPPSDQAPPTAPAQRPRPVATPLSPAGENERLLPIDALRGTALLGILMMNIITFALPFAAMMNPATKAVTVYTGEFSGLNFWLWVMQHALFDQKMMTIFSMLFGAGLVLMAGRAADRGANLRGIHYRRMLWLLVFGLLHAYFFWYGDILTLYAICGMLLYPLRKLRPFTLITIGSLSLVIPVVAFVLMGLALGYVRGVADEAQALIAAGETPSSMQRDMLEAWTAARAGFDPTPQQVADQVAAFRGTPLQVLRANVELALGVQLQMIPLWGLWRAGGLMLIGMAFMKLGIFSCMCSTRFYTAMLALGYGIGLPIVAIGMLDQIESGFDPIRQMILGWHYNYVGSIAVSLGHIALVMLVYRSGVLKGLIERLASVGRMALTNYFAQTFICTFFFFGWGLGFFAMVGREWLVLFVLSIWAMQLAWSPWWLDRFRYGPAEWLWRSLTYGTIQPLRR